MNPLEKLTFPLSNLTSDASVHPNMAIVAISPRRKAAGSFLFGSLRRIRQYFTSIRARTTLVQDPFSTEQTRD